MGKYTLRWYQEEAVEAVFEYFSRRDGNPLLELPTGSGKSLTQAGLIERAVGEYPSTRFLCITHVQELVQQNHDALLEHAPQFTFKAGINSAGLGRRDFDRQVLFAGVQSVYNKADKIGHVDLLVIDECHMVPKSGDGMFRQLIDGLKMINPSLKVIGMTATPYRLNGGMLTAGEGAIFSSICYKVDILRMIQEGYLSHIVTHKGAASYDTSEVKTRGGDFVQSDLAVCVESSEEITAQACEEIVALGNEQGRKHWLLFATSVKHADEICDIIEALGEVRPSIVTGETDKTKRKKLIDAYKAGEIKCLVNVGVLTTGFNAPHVDLIGMIRPTQSPGLYVQILGRGLRTAEGKTDCLFLDYGENIERHGPINAIKPPKTRGKGKGDAPIKECPNCRYESVPAGSRFCPECEYEFPPADIKVQTKASHLDVVRTDFPWFKVESVVYRRHEKRGKADSLRVDYMHGVTCTSEWVCLEHEGFAKRKATQWIKQRTPEDLFPPIEEVQDALSWCNQIASPCYVQVDDSGKYDRIIGYRWEGDENPIHEGEVCGPAPKAMSDQLESRGLGYDTDTGEMISMGYIETEPETDPDGFYDDDLPF